ncbi:uncharacterized protein LOC119285818 [Triticum dicoccoides]|uniref:uncharacterized protein LOC119285818 n=1 Tax=Triticum dicoccoides TaxID=85692 RepID=UPI00188E7DE0|nr:uncharacterized protein LOC119285818 [Triticum dicoccoides]XP_044360380.1 uncharacterized protein LOC123081967 [Triticum aestivum]
MPPPTTLPDRRASRRSPPDGPLAAAIHPRTAPPTALPPRRASRRSSASSDATADGPPSSDAPLAAVPQVRPGVNFERISGWTGCTKAADSTTHAFVLFDVQVFSC